MSKTRGFTASEIITRLTEYVEQHGDGPVHLKIMLKRRKSPSSCHAPVMSIGWHGKAYNDPSTGHISLGAREEDFTFSEWVQSGVGRFLKCVVSKKDTAS